MNKVLLTKITLAALVVLLFPFKGSAIVPNKYYAQLTATVSTSSTGRGTVYVAGENEEQTYGPSSTNYKYSNYPGNSDWGYVNITASVQYNSSAYKFEGWADSDGTPGSYLSTDSSYSNYYRVSTEKSTSDDPKAAPYYIYAYFSPIIYTLHYDINGATINNPIPDKGYNIESVFNLPERTFRKDGYDFTGWKPTSNAGNWRTTETFGDQAEISGKYGNVTLQAQWELITYTIFYDANGGSVSSNTQEFTINSTDSLLAPARDGYTFAGWEVVEFDPDEGNWDYGDAESPLDHKFGDVWLKAKWTLNNYTISYAAGDHSTGGSTSATAYNIESGFALASNGFTPEEGWVFDKWKVTTAGSGSSGNWTLGSTYEEVGSIAAGKFGNVTMTALWKENPLADITIIVTGLEEGESAVFTVTRTDLETPISTVSITGNSSGTSSVTIKSQQTGFQYQVRPINAWAWTYTMDPNGGMVIGLGKNGATFEFEATKKSSVKKNDEQVQVNWQP